MACGCFGIGAIMLFNTIMVTLMLTDKNDQANLSKPDFEIAKRLANFKECGDASIRLHLDAIPTRMKTSSIQNVIFFLIS